MKRKNVKLKQVRNLKIHSFFGISFVMCSILMLSFAWVGEVDATDYYVSTTGSNDWTGLSPETAWRTIAYAVGSGSAVSSGDTIYVLDGTYTEGYNNIIFQHDNITLTAYNQSSPNVVIDGGISDNQNHYVLTLYNRNNITIDKLEIINGGIGIDARDSNYIDITDCVVHGAAWMGIEICGNTSGSGSHHCSIDNCEIYSCGWNLVALGGLTDQPYGIDGAVSTNLSVTNCKIHDGIGHGLIDLCGDMEHIDIINNTLRNGIHGNFYTHQTVNGGKYYRIHNNSITGGVEGFHLDGKVDDSSFIGNTIENVDDYHIQITKNMNNLTFKDNTYIGSVDHDVLVFGSNYLFESETGIERYDIRDGSGIIRNAIADSFTVQSGNDAVITVEFTDGRTFSVDGKGEYTSYIFSSGTRTIKIVGWTSVSGTVTNAADAPIQGVKVSTNGYSTTTNSTGVYTINLPGGNYIVTASKLSYLSQTKPAKVNAGETVTLDFQLEWIGSSREIFVHPNPHIRGKGLTERISFGNLPKEATLKIYTVSGDLVKTTKHKDIADGGSEEWDVSGIASGVYIYYVESSEGKKTGKVSIVK